MVLTGALLGFGAAGFAWVWWRRPEQRRTTLGLVAAGGLGFQGLHAIEHVAQAVAWVAAPDQPPFLTPWAIAGRDALAVGGDAALGAELLHLLGNVVFLVGLVALAVLARATGARNPSLRFALVVQGAHVAEHVALTASSALVGHAVGVTTLLGLLDGGPALWTLRVAAHLLLNGVATVAAALGALAWVRAAGEQRRGRVPLIGRA